MVADLTERGATRLVTDANSHVGYNLIAALAARGHDVTAAIRSLDDAVATIKKLDPLAPGVAMELPGFIDAMVPAFDWFNHKVLGLPRTMPKAFHKNFNANSQLIPTTARIRSELGWRQAIDFQTSIADTMTALRALWAREKRANR